MRIVGALVTASAIPVLLLGAFGLISVMAAIVIAILAIVLGVIIVAVDSL
jgi:hypothetical protein